MVVLNPPYFLFIPDWTANNAIYIQQPPYLVQVWGLFLPTWKPLAPGLLYRYAVFWFNRSEPQRLQLEVSMNDTLTALDWSPTFKIQTLKLLARISQAANADDLWRVSDRAAGFVLGLETIEALMRRVSRACMAPLRRLLPHAGRTSRNDRMPVQTKWGGYIVSYTFIHK